MFELKEVLPNAHVALVSSSFLQDQVVTLDSSLVTSRKGTAALKIGATLIPGLQNTSSLSK